jgi:23S rRNA (guanosine2251-2'-O)-methyltransferase
VVEVEGGTLTAVSGFDGHQGVALVVAPRHQATLDEALAIAKARVEPPFLLVLDHLEDPQNVGALLRSAEASGVHGVVLPAHGSAPLSPATIKSSAGAVEHLAVVTVPDLAACLADLHARGLRVVGADGDAPLTVREVDLRGPLAVVIGNEGRGLTGRLRRRVDVMARVPMRGRVASLNASVAGSIVMYEAAVQRGLPETELPGTYDAPEAEPGAAAEAPAPEAGLPELERPGPEPSGPESAPRTPRSEGRKPSPSRAKAASAPKTAADSGASPCKRAKRSEAVQADDDEDALLP